MIEYSQFLYNIFNDLKISIDILFIEKSLIFKISNKFKGYFLYN